ncbi:MAG: hypothetical protein ACTJH8_10575, partial [Agrococcus casei]
PFYVNDATLPITTNREEPPNQAHHPLVWRVDERFESESAFRLHQRRAAASAWGRQTAGIERDYSITG